MRESLPVSLRNSNIISDFFKVLTDIIVVNNSRFKNVYRRKKLKEMIFYLLIDTNDDYMKKDISSSLVNLAKR